MKKLICTFLALCLVFSLSVSAMAAEYANIFDLMLDWEENGYPDDVGGVYSTDGTSESLTVLLVDDGDHSRENEIRAMLDDDTTASFAACQYSMSQLQTIRNEIVNAYMEEDHDIYGCGVGWGSNGGFGASGQELRVIVTVAEDRVEEYSSLLSERYADAVVVEAGEMVYTEDAEADLEEDLFENADDATIDDALATAPQEAPTTNAAPSEESKSATVWIVALAVVVVLARGLFFLLRRKKAQQGKSK